MKIKKIVTVVLVLSLVVVGFSSMGIAYGGFARRGFGQHLRIRQKEFFDELDLSDEQTEVLSSIKEEFFTERIKLQEELRELNRELTKLILSDATTEEIAGIRNKINILQNNMLDIKTNHLEDLKENLTEKQLEIVKESLGKIQSFFSRREGRFVQMRRGRFMRRCP